jgi:hypothetical protein
MPRGRKQNRNIQARGRSSVFDRKDPLNLFKEHFASMEDKIVGMRYFEVRTDIVVKY